MNKMLFLAAGFAALMMTACGGEEKKEDKKEEKKELSAETLQKVDGLKVGFSTIDGMFTTIDGALATYDVAKQTAYLDSMKTVAGKAKKDIKDKALPLIDSLVSLNNMVDIWKTSLASEKETWGSITEDFTSVMTSIEKGEADDETINARYEGFSIQFEAKTVILNEIAANWAKIDTHRTALNALFAPAVK